VVVVKLMLVDVSLLRKSNCDRFLLFLDAQFGRLHARIANSLVESPVRSNTSHYDLIIIRSDKLRSHRYETFKVMSHESSLDMYRLAILDFLQYTKATVFKNTSLKNMSLPYTSNESRKRATIRQPQADEHELTVNLSPIRNPDSPTIAVADLP
jgi:hypothetical protein